MRPLAGSATRLVAPVRGLAQRFAFPFLILAAFGLMLFGKAETVMVERLRADAVDIVSPILAGLSRPLATVADMAEAGGRLVDLHAENRRLRAQNRRLLRWQQAARSLAAENESLRRLLDYAPGPEARSVAARVIAKSGGVFARTVLVDAGERHGVAKGQTVVADRGLVGRIVSAGSLSARALLVTDLNSRIPVLVERSRARAILAGDNRPRPRLEFADPAGGVAAGDRILTSGHGDLFPVGVPIGVVVAEDGAGLRVRPFVRLHRIEHVRILERRAPGPPPAP